MSTLDSMRDNLTTYTRQKAGVVDQLLALNTQLVSANKNSEKRRINNAIKNLEQQDKRLAKLISDLNDDIKKIELSENKFDAKTEAYKAGIDPNKAWADAISSGVGAVSSTIGQFAGVGALTKLGSGGGNDKKPTDQGKPVTHGAPTAEKDNTMLYVGIGAVVLFMLMKK